MTLALTRPSALESDGGGDRMLWVARWPGDLILCGLRRGLGTFTVSAVDEAAMRSVFSVMEALLPGECPVGEVRFVVRSPDELLERAKARSLQGFVVYGPACEILEWRFRG